MADPTRAQPGPQAPPEQPTGIPPGRVALIMGIFAAAMAVWVLPLLVGLIALIFGATALAKGERRGWWVIGAAFVGTGLGLLVELLPEKLVGG